MAGVVDFSDAIGIALITSSLINGKSDPRWYVRHGWLAGAAAFYLGRVVENYLLQQAAVQLANANGGKLPAGYEMFQPYLPPSYTGVQTPAVTPSPSQALTKALPGVAT